MRRLTLLAAAAAAACLFGFYASPYPLALLVALSLCVRLSARRLAAYGRHLSYLSAGFLFGSLLFFLYTAYAYAPAQSLERRTIRLEAVVTGFPGENSYGVTVPVRGNERGARPVNLSLRLESTFASLQPGDRIVCVVYCQSSNRDGGPFAQFSRARGIFLTAKAYGEVTVTPPERVPWRYLPLITARALDDLLARLYPQEYAGFLTALLTGDTAGISDNDRNAFARTGLSHVVSVSGMHVSFLAGILYLLLGRERKSAAALQIIIVFFFAAMTGGNPSALRAAVFWVVGLLAPFLRRRSDHLTSLSAALLFLLILRPYSIADLGLQLSFAATVGILLLARPLQSVWLARIPLREGLLRRILAGFLGLAAVSLGVNVFTIPLSALYFGEISLLSPVANLLSNWAVALAFLGGVLSLVLGAISLPLGSAIAAIVELPLRFFLWAARMGNRLTFAALPLDSVYYSLLLLFLYVLLLLTLLCRRRGERRVVLPLAAGVKALCFSLLLTNWSLKGRGLTLALLDVGQGQCVPLLSDGFRALIDCGGSREAGTLAAAYFQGQGYGRLDLLVITHYDTDHCNGVASLFSRMEVGTLALPDRAPENPVRRELEALARREGSTLWYIEEETSVPFGNATLTLYPPLGDADDNDSGLSVLCTLGEWDALVTGDMSSGVEALLLKRHALPDIELLVAGHHGSQYSTSEALLDALTPETALISAGTGNPYGHPAQETLARLHERDIAVYRSDKMGDITVTLKE